MTDQTKPFNTAEWNKKLKQAESIRTNFERQWFNNMAFYRGNQWVTWVKNPAVQLGVSLTQPKSNRKRLVFNKIRPYIRNEFTKLTKEEAQFFVSPLTSELTDVSAAKTAEAIAEYLMYIAKFNAARRAGVWWSSLCGVGFMKTWYDNGYKLPAITDPTGQMKEQVTGAVRYDGISPFHIFVPYLDVEDLADQPWIIHGRTYDAQHVKAVYKKSVEPDTKSSAMGSEQRFLSSINANASNRFNQVYLKEVWIKPCAEYELGKLVIFAGEEVLFEADFPYQHGEFPFQKFNGTRSGGFYGSSIIEDLIPMQKEFNLVKSQIAEARDLTSKPALTVTKGTVDIKKIKAIPGQIIEVQPGGEPPKRLVNPDFPQYVVNDMEGTIREMDNAAGQFEITRGHTPPGIEAASAIAYLQEENDTRLHDAIASIEDAVSESGRQSLQLVQQYWDQTRIVKTVSATHLQGTIEFKGKDLRNNTDLRVVSGSMAPRSAAAKQAFILEAIKMQLIPPAVGLKYLPLNDTESMYNEVQVDNNHAQRENLRMARGEQVQVMEWDNHVVHVQEHENFMKSQEFELLDPQMQQIFVEHRKQHQTVVMAEENIQNGPGTAADAGVQQPEQPAGEQSPIPVQ